MSCQARTHDAGERASLANRDTAALPAWLAEAFLTLAILIAAAAVRWQFVAIGIPAFLTPDSDDYVLPAYRLATSTGFDPEIRRTPLYPVFLASVFAFGGNLATVTAAQHVLGVVTCLLTYVLGRLAFGRIAGTIAGASIAISGPQIIYEHYVMSEVLFTCVLTAFLVIALWSAPRGTLPLIATGIAAALCALTRPIGQAAYGLALMGPILIRRTGRKRATLTVLAAFLVASGPWAVRGWLIHGESGATSALGQALIGRTVRHDRGFVYDDPRRPDPDPVRAAARKIIQEEARGEPSGGTITARLQSELGLTPAQTAALLRSLAVEVILDQPGYYASGTARMAWQLFQGTNERLLGSWRQRTTRNWDTKWGTELSALLDPEIPASGEPYERADAITSAYQPWRWRSWIAALFLLGTLAAIVRPGWRLALLPSAAALGLVGVAAAFDGLVWRFRYPVDPAIAVVAAGGISACLTVVASGIRFASTRLKRN
ncbi:MAG: hypothetical protein U0821_01240 [Chloroflexota bacterium]